MSNSKSSPIFHTIRQAPPPDTWAVRNALEHQRLTKLKQPLLTSCLLFCFALILLNATPVLSQTEVEGEVSGVWDTDGSPYVLIGDATVSEDDSLTIEPGVEVEFGEELTLTVSGHITAQGTEEDTIRIHGPEGLISGRIRINTEEDTARFAYCRFDSLQSGLLVLIQPVELVHSRFYNCARHIDLRGRWVYVANCALISDTLGQGSIRIGQWANVATDAAIFIDNLIRGTLVMYIMDVIDVIFTDNVAEPYIILEHVYYTTLEFGECSNVTCTDNHIGFGMGTINQFRRLEEAVFENNDVRSIAIIDNANWGAIVRNNRLASTSGGIAVMNAFAEVYNNEANYFNLSDGAVAIAEHNLLHGINVDGVGCEAEINNNTIVSHSDDPSTPVINIKSRDVEDASLILSNNIISSFRIKDFAVHPTIEVTDGGYNCFSCVEQPYGGREGVLEGDIIENPLMRDGLPYDYRLRADSPCIDAGDPDSPEDPDYTRADIGCYFFDQENGEPPALNRRWDYYIGWHETFRYAAEAVDEGEELDIRFEDLPEWLEVEEDDGRRDFVRDSVIVSGEVPEDQEDFVFRVIATDDQDREDTLSVRVMVYPYRVLTGVVRGVLDVEQSPFIVADTAWVPASDSLVLPPGTELYFDNREDELTGRKPYLGVMGRMIAVGNEDDSIFVLPFQPDERGSGIRLMANDEALSNFEYCHFVSLSFGSQGHSAYIRNCLLDGTGARINGNSLETIIENNVCNGTGFSLTGKGRISNNYIETTSLTGISIMGGNEEDSIIVNRNTVFTGRNGLINWGSKFDLIHDNYFICTSDEEHIDGLDLANLELIEDANALVINNTISGFWYGINLQGGYLKAKLNNNAIKGTNTGLFSIFSSLPECAFTNNLIMNCHNGYILSNFWPEPAAEYLRVCSNLFLNDSILIHIVDPEVDYDNFRYNSIFGSDSLGNEPNFIGSLLQVNTNGDSCDAHFNIYLDPRIANPDSLDFRLYSDSPLIDAGNPDSSFNDVDSTINDIGLYGGPYGMAYEYLDPNEVLSFDAQPRDFQVGNAYPNPFNATSHISIDIPSRGNVTFSLFDIQGRRVAHHSLQLTAGTHRGSLSEFLNTDVSGLRSGLYVLTIEFGGSRINRKLVLVK